LYARYFIGKGDGHLFIHDLHLKYGPIVQFTPDRVSIITKEGISKIYNSYKYIKTDYYRAFDHGGLNIFSTTERDVHKIRKRILTPIFSLKSLEYIEPIMNEAGFTPFINKLEEIAQSSSEGGDLNLYIYLHHLFFDITTVFSFGENFNLINDSNHPIVKQLEESQEYCILSYQFPILKKFGNWFGKLSYDALTNFCKDLIEKRKADKSGKQFNDVMDMFINSVDPNTNEPFSDDDIASEMVIQILGGTDTSANTLTFAIKLLLENPQVLRKLTEELDRVFPDKYEHITSNKVKTQCPYLDAVLNEVLRFYPVASGFLPRVVPKGGAEFSNYYIPEGTEVGITGLAYHRTELHWTDPDKFIPERFLGDGAKLRNYIFTFLVGPRSCIGREMAWVSLYVVLASMIRRFHFTMENSHIPLKTSTFLLLKPSNGLKVRISSRA